MSRNLRRKPPISYSEVEELNLDKHVAAATSRNLRRKPRISYYEVEEPNLDEYVFCDECGDYVYEYCSIHGPLLVLPDDKVATPTGFPSFVPRAALTIPREFLHLNVSTIPDAGLGVFATLTLPKGVRFGPYRGERTKEANSEYCWQLFDGGTRRPTCVVDARDPQRSNWMRYVNCSRHCSEQNLVAYQYQGELYYRTIKIVPRMSELLVFYGTEYARALRVDLRLYNSAQGQLLTGAFSENKPESKNDDTSSNLVIKKHETADAESQISNNVATETHQIDTKCKTVVNNDNTTKVCKKSVTTSKPTEKRLEKSDVPSVNLTQDKNNNSLSHTAKKYSFNKCNYRTENSVHINSHMKAHAASNSFCCDMCSYKTMDKSHLIRHLKTHTGEKPFICEICDKKFAQRNTLVRHTRIHTGEKPFTCDICDKKFTQKPNLDSHTRIHTGEKPYSCHICDKKFACKSTLVEHTRIHTGEKPYSCHICDKKFTQKQHLDRHTRIHTGEKPYSCHICDKKFTQKSDLVRHTRIHTGEKLSACHICDKKFTQKSDLVRHTRIHTGEKLYACHICDKKFTDKGVLVRHTRIHTGEKPYSCHICDKKFTDKSDLVKHTRIHTGEKPYSCEICDKKFKQRQHLNGHLRVHTRLKP